MSSPERSSPERSSAERSDRRRRLLEETLRLVSEAGLGAVTHRNVEQAAGAPHGSVTYWFGSREGLISALVDWLCDESERQARAIATPVQQQIAAGQKLDIDAIAAALSAWMDTSAAHHLARMELELQGAREPAHAERMTKAAQVFWDMCAAIAEGLGSDDPERDGRAMAVMLDGVLLDRLAHPPQSQDVVAASVRWLLSGPPAPDGKRI
ncbi:MAG TPA: TetR/AcrR family transcriptional regulator [Solirubrobacteraceae bacterium]|nr:TetR/AcrR family transcriptional regulator [Solirubrobacteraceae bacterium]